MIRLLNVGYRNLHPRFGWYEVVEQIDSQNYIVRFDNTGYQYRCSKYHILDNYVCDKSSSYFHQIGEEYFHPVYGKYVIVEILKGKKAIIEFENTKYKCEATICNIRNKRVKDVMCPIIYGVGYIGEQRTITKQLSESEAYTCWRNMIKRCYDPNEHIKHPTYKDCKVCDEWLCFINFLNWFNAYYKDGWQLDKDILIKGNKIYSPDTCCFVPSEINSLFTKRQNHRGNTPIGVKCCKAERRFKECYKASFTRDTTKVYLGSFKTQDEAFNAYKTAKEQYIKEIADKYKDQLESRTYEALYNYKVEITD